MAYSSAITICGGQDIYMSANNWVSYIPLVLAGIVFSMIVFNQKGVRTWIAATLALFSVILILLSHQLLIPGSFYNIGGAGLLLSIWVNSNLLSFAGHLSNVFLNGFRRVNRQKTYLINQK